MVSPLLAKAASKGREIVNVTPERAGWTHVGFRAVRLAAGESETVATGTPLRNTSASSSWWRRSRTASAGTRRPVKVTPW